MFDRSNRSSSSSGSGVSDQGHLSNYTPAPTIHHPQDPSGHAPFADVSVSLVQILRNLSSLSRILNLIMCVDIINSKNVDVGGTSKISEVVEWVVTSFTTAKKGTIPMPSSSGVSALQLHQQRQIATIETPPNNASLPMQIPTVTMDLASDISTSEAGELEAVAAQTVLAYSNPTNAVTVVGSGNGGGASGAPPTSPKETLQVSTIATGRVGLNVPVPPSMGSNNSINALNNNNGSVAMDGGAPPGAGGNGSAGATGGLQTPGNELRVSPIAGRCRALSVGVDTDMPIFGRKSNNQQRRNEAKTTAKNQQPAATAAKNQHQQQQQVVKAELEPAIPKTPKPRDPEKEKRRIARKKEKRATLILGLIMGSFIACWLPFFFLYILVPACSSHCNIPESAFAVAFWLGYMNSALNPAIYTIFNKDFRRAFRRILFK
uniref:Uncharacterized protein LOC108047608 n=1 Tax=Drosophila rhopaloa TaxID=1041015 RepID=A0A6P4F7N2_DRORH